MNNFGKRLKGLRKSAQVTQEQLAGALGISYQAVSKWENGLGLPDISLLPGISNFFGVSTDWLLGVDSKCSDEVIEAVLGEAFRLKHIAKTQEGITLIEKALTTYPNNHKLLAEWLELKVYNFEATCKKDEWLKEVETKAKIVLRDCTDDFVRYKAKLALTFAYSYCGEKQKAEKLCSSFPDEAYSRLEMFAMIAAPKERVQYKRGCICGDLEKLLTNILSVAKHYYCFADPNKAIPVCNTALSIINAVGNEGFLIYYLAKAYSDLAGAYAKLNNKIKVIANAKKAFEAYLLLDCLCENGDYYYRSTLLKGEVFNKEKIVYGAPHSATEEYVQKISQMRSYYFLKADSDFAALLQEMKAKAILYRANN